MKTEEKIQRYANRTYAGLVWRSFLYCLIPTFIFYLLNINSGVHPDSAFAQSFIGCYLLIFGALIIQKKVAIKIISKL